jgi:hypothetical protein
MKRIVFCLQLVALMMPLREAVAQKEANIWYFGNHAGLDFNTGTPVALSNGALTITDNSSTICDSMGNLLFYTNGETVWNKNHQVMNNGFNIGGSTSGGQAALIIKQPSNDSIYYIFTADAFGASGGLKYSIVNMNASGGLGTVMQKGIVLQNPSTEKLAGFYNCSENFTWLITHRSNSNEFCCYKITASGLDTIPVISAIGTIHPAGTYGVVTGTAGQMSISKNGSKIGCVKYLDGTIEIFDFNISTGVLSNPILLPVTIPKVLAVEFSPDETKMYIGVYNVPDVYQFDISSGNPMIILSSSTVVGTMTYNTCPGFSGFIGYMQRGPDDKIYIAKCGFNHISVINEPNKPGLLCNFNNIGVQLGSGISTFGLSRAVTPECRSLGIQELNKKELFSVSPNPNNGNFNISISNLNGIKNLNIKIFNSMKKIVYSEKTNLNGSKNINVNLKPGMYFIEFNWDNHSVFKKMIVY